MQKISPFLWFESQAEEAANLQDRHPGPGGGSERLAIGASRRPIENPARRAAGYIEATRRSTADVDSRTGQTLNQMTAVRAPVRPVSTASAMSRPATAR